MAYDVLISTAPARVVDLTDERLTPLSWEKVGTVNLDRERELQKRLRPFLRQPGGARSGTGFYLDADPDAAWVARLLAHRPHASHGMGLDGLPGFWLAVDLTRYFDCFAVTVVQAQLKPLGRRPPEPEPGLLSPTVALPIGVSSKGGDVFEAVRTAS